MFKNKVLNLFITYTVQKKNHYNPLPRKIKLSSSHNNILKWSTLMRHINIKQNIYKQCHKQIFLFIFTQNSIILDLGYFI